MWKLLGHQKDNISSDLRKDSDGLYQSLESWVVSGFTNTHTNGDIFRSGKEPVDEDTHERGV